MIDNAWDAEATEVQVTVPGYFPDTPGVRQQLANVCNNITYADRLTNDLLKKLCEDGLEEDTIVIFYGDHGDGIPRIKTHLYHESLRVPLIVKIPAKFRNDSTPAPGSAVDELVALTDLGPTILSLAGIQPPAGWDDRACLGQTDAASLEALRRGLKNRTPFIQLETLQLIHHIGPAVGPVKPDLQRLTKAKTPPLYARQIGYAAEFALKAVQQP